MENEEITKQELVKTRMRSFNEGYDKGFKKGQLEKLLEVHDCFCDKARQLIQIIIDFEVQSKSVVNEPYNILNHPLNSQERVKKYDTNKE